MKRYEPSRTIGMLSHGDHASDWIPAIPGLFLMLQTLRISVSEWYSLGSIKWLGGDWTYHPLNSEVDVICFTFHPSYWEYDVEFWCGSPQWASHPSGAGSRSSSITDPCAIESFPGQVRKTADFFRLGVPWVWPFGMSPKIGKSTKNKSNDDGHS